MYREHVPIIRAGMLLQPKIMARGIMFAVLSARQPFYRVPEQLAAIERDGDASPALFSWKIDAYRYVQENRDALYHRLRLARTTADALFEVTRIPGVGVVKGAFVCQLLGHDIACFDSQNQNREIGGRTREWETRGNSGANAHRKTWPSFRRLIDRYIDQFGGHAERYWDEWCADVGPKYAMSPEECSRVHLCIVPTTVRNRLQEQMKPPREWPCIPNIPLREPPEDDSIPF